MPRASRPEPEDSSTDDQQNNRSRVSIEVKTIGMIVVAFVILAAVFFRQLTTSQLAQMMLVLAAAFALVVIVLDVWVFRPLHSLIRRSRHRLGSRYERQDPMHRDEIRELEHLINLIIRTFTEVETQGIKTEVAESELLKQRSFNEQLVKVNHIGQSINAALPYRETMDRILTETKILLKADFIALIALEKSTRAYELQASAGVTAQDASADCCLYTADCPVRQALSEKSVVRSADHTCTLFPKTMKSQLILPFSVDGDGQMALLATATTNEHFEQVSTNALSTLQGHMESALSNARKYDGIRRQVTTDHLTRLYNRQFFKARLDEELDKSLRNQQPLSLVMIDIDHFKSFNDTYGHQTGDKVLQVVGQVIGAGVRTSDVCARYGGEEFVMLLPKTPGEAATYMADRLRKTLGQTRYTGLGLPANVNITISLGVATCPGDATTAEELFELADKALYQAKAGGRDRVVQHGVQTPQIIVD
ncbi:MAG: diguanylate cyclase [Thermoleophilia bacterium]